MNLEPRFEPAGTTILEELQEINEIIFISKGRVAVGFEINKKKEFALTFHDKVVIGAYNCTFKKRANYCFHCLTFCEGYSLRKANWLDSLEAFPEIAISIR
jgi:CRP-like cAMP-binding protein